MFVIKDNTQITHNSVIILPTKPQSKTAKETHIGLLMGYSLPELHLRERKNFEHGS